MTGNPLPSTPVDLDSLPNLAAMLQSSAERFGARPAQWYRKNGDYLPITYSQLWTRVRHVAAGLIAAGIKPGDRVAIAMENRPEWAIADFAILAAGAVTVPLYTCYRAPEMAYVLDDAGAVAAFCSGGKLLQTMGQAQAQCRHLRHIYCVDEPGDAAGDDGLVLNMSTLEGREFDAVALDKRMAAIDREQLATLAYTSGTTGNPKGVMLSHGNILSNLDTVPAVYPLQRDERMLSFLPLAHMLERTCGHFLVYAYGISVAFAERPDTVAKNMAEARPTVMISVPRMLEVVRARILGQLANQSRLKRWLFSTYLSLAGRTERRFCAERGYRLLDRLVGAKIRDRFGGRLRLLISGGAPLCPEIGEFFNALGLPVIEGYGLTESAPMLAANPMHDRRFGSVGQAVVHVELKLAEDGELLARGPNVMTGYWHNRSATREALIDGWLHTGDIGRFDADGYLYITDRKKDLIVNSGGENIAPQRIEGLLVLDAEIDQVVVYGDQKPYLVALVVPNREVCMAWATEQGLPETDWDHLCDSPILKKHLQTHINRVLKPLNPYEQVRRLHLLHEPFTIESGLLTPTQKVKRRKVYEQYRDTLEALYGQ